MQSSGSPHGSMGVFGDADRAGVRHEDTTAPSRLLSVRCKSRNNLGLESRRRHFSGHTITEVKRQPETQEHSKRMKIREDMDVGREVLDLLAPPKTHPER